MNDTIAAISTTLGVGAISIIRVSGSDAIKIVNSIFKGKDLKRVESHTISYGHIKDGDNLLDEVLVSVMKSPKTFTTEDIVEINCHGGIATTKWGKTCRTRRIHKKSIFKWKNRFITSRINNGFNKC